MPEYASFAGSILSSEQAKAAYWAEQIGPQFITAPIAPAVLRRQEKQYFKGTLAGGGYPLQSTEERAEVMKKYSEPQTAPPPNPATSPKGTTVNVIGMDVIRNLLIAMIVLQFLQLFAGVGGGMLGGALMSSIRS